MLEGLPEHVQTETIVDIMVSEAIKISEIEGEYLSRKDVMSSIKNNLGIAENIEHVQDIKAEGAAALITDVRHTYIEAMIEEKLFERHKNAHERQ